MPETSGFRQFCFTIGTSLSIDEIPEGRGQDNIPETIVTTDFSEDV